MGNGQSSSLHNAAGKNQISQVRSLLTERNMDPNMRDEDGWVPLHFAAYGGAAGAARELMNRGAKVGATDKEGRTPLHLASLKGQLAVVQQLILAGADVNVADMHKLRPLHKAAIGGNAEVCKALCSAGAEVNAEVEDGSNPIHLAAWKGNHDVIKALIPLGGDYKKPRKDGNTALHEAAQCGDEKLLIALMRLGADRFSRNQDGKTPSEIATEYEHEEAAKLISQGPPPKGAGKPAATMPGSHSEAPSAPSAPHLPAEFTKGGHVQYPTIGAPQGGKQPDWWRDNIGREVAQSAPQPATQPGSRQEFEQNLGKGFQDAVGNIAKGFGALQQGVFGGGQRREGQPAPAATQAPPSDTKEFKPAAREDEWGSTKTPARRNVPASQVKTDLQPYDSDDYGHNLGAPQDRQAGPDGSPGEIQRKLAQLELSVDGAQGWQRGGQSKTARQKQQEEIRRLQAQLDGYKRGNGSHGYSSYQAPAKAGGRTPPSEFVCPITQEVMKEPVMAADGYTYEKAAIVEWLKSGHTISPIANEPLSHPGLTSNHGLRKAIQKWQTEH